MPETFTKNMARNIYSGGSVLFILLFLALTYHTEKTLPERTNKVAMSTAVVRGKLVWEQDNCVGCYTLLGEGTRFASGLGNVAGRRGSEEGFNTFLQARTKTQPLSVPGRRTMPQFHLSEGQVDDLAESLKWNLKIDTNQQSPSKEG